MITAHLRQCGTRESFGVVQLGAVPSVGATLVGHTLTGDQHHAVAGVEWRLDGAIDVFIAPRAVPHYDGSFLAEDGLMITYESQVETGASRPRSRCGMDFPWRGNAAEFVAALCERLSERELDGVAHALRLALERVSSVRG